jgi:hypothetical protein
VFFKPAIIALFTGSLLISGMLLFAAYYAVKILWAWDIHSGSETQLNLERRTYLISTIMSYGLAFQLFSFFLFIYTADHLHTYFTGAMCAAGSLNVNGWGYPTIGFKILNFLLAGCWLILNYADNRGYDYPLIRQKYSLLLWLTPLILAEAVSQTSYFLGLQPEVITSCCGTQFTSEARSMAADVIGFPVTFMETGFVASLIATFGLGIFFYRTAKWGYLFSGFCLLTFLISLASLISFISIYIYELPTHHCPFCILQREYGYVGYPLYLTLLGGTLMGLGVGMLTPYRNIESLKESYPVLQKRLALVSLLFYSIFAAIVAYRMITSNLIM